MELKEMILIYINGNLIENMIIQDNKLLFSDSDSNNGVVYKTVPVNEYEETSNTYLEVQSILYDVLEFDKEENIEAFKECCLMQYIEGNNSFTFEDLDVYLEGIEEDPNIKIID